MGEEMKISLAKTNDNSVFELVLTKQEWLDSYSWAARFNISVFCLLFPHVLKITIKGD